MKKLYALITFLTVASSSILGQTPTMDCPTNISVDVDPGTCSAVVNYTDPTCATNCTGATITQTDATGYTNGDAFPVGVTILEYTISSVGGSSTCSFSVTVTDNEAPTFNPVCPGDISVNNDAGVCGAEVQYTRPKGIDACGSFPTLQVDGTGFTSSNIFPIGTTLQEFTCTDDAGNVATCSFNVTVTDVEAPTFSDCPTPQSFDSEVGTCGATVTYTMPTGADNCITTTLTQTDATGLTSGDFFPIGTTIQEYQVTDQYGNVGSTCSMEIIVVDVNAPTISCPLTQNQFMDNNCEVSVADFTGMATIGDECSTSIVTVTQSPAAGSTLASTGTYTVTLTATDTSGNSSDCTFDLIVSDMIAPDVTCLSDQNVSAGAGCTATLQDYTGVLTVSDNCDSNPIITQSPAAGTAITTSETVTMTVTDASGNETTCSFEVIVDDPVAPTITCPSDVTDYVDSNCDYTVPDFTGGLVVTDNCDSNPTIQQVPSPGSTISGTGSQFISFSASDVSGNVSFCSITLTLEDTSGPAITCPADLDVYIDGNCDYEIIDYTSLVTGADNCGGGVFYTQTPVIGTIYHGDDSPVTVDIEAQDLLGNTSTCSFNLILVDTIAPSIVSCPNDTIVEADNNCVYVIADFTSLISGSDNCSSLFTLSQSLNAGDTLLAGGPYPITLYLEDDEGNQDSCSFTIKVDDITAPTMDCPLNPDVPADATCSYTIPEYDTTLNITDNCSGWTYTQSVAAGTVISGIGTQQAISVFVTDFEGNIGSCSFTITVVDTTSPDITCPSDTALNIGVTCQYTVPDFTSLAAVVDLCDPSPTVTQSPISGVTLSGINTVTITAEDADGNMSTCTLSVSPNDTIAPTITCPDSIATCDNVVTYTEPSGVDECVTATTTQTDGTGLTSGSTFPVGTTTLEYTVTDLVGNDSTCSFDITIYPPVVIDPGSSSQIEEGESVTIDATISNAAGFIWSPDYNIDSVDSQNPTVTPGVTTYYTVTAVSPDGCTATDSVLILVNTIDTLIVNNFFSPNGDGSNETWNVNKPALISGCWVTIYNRWGKKVWESNQYSNDWTGLNYNGDPLPEGTYFYVISCASGEPVKGSVMLMR